MERALCEGRERPDALDLVREELHADRLASGRPEDVDDAAAHCELAALLDTIDPLVARQRKPLGQPLDAGLVADRDLDRAGTKLRRGQALREAQGGRAHETAPLEDLERPRPLSDQVRRRREAAFERDSARRQQPDALGAHIPACRFGRVARVRVFRKQADKPVLSPGRMPAGGEEERQERLGDARRGTRTRCLKCTQPLGVGELERKGLQNRRDHGHRRDDVSRVAILKARSATPAHRGPHPPPAFEPIGSRRAGVSRRVTSVQRLCVEPT